VQEPHRLLAERQRQIGLAGQLDARSCQRLRREPVPGELELEVTEGGAGEQAHYRNSGPQLVLDAVAELGRHQRVEAHGGEGPPLVQSLRVEAQHTGGEAAQGRDQRQLFLRGAARELRRKYSR
jgi:hypothetical protein